MNRIVNEIGQWISAVFIVVVLAMVLAFGGVLLSAGVVIGAVLLVGYGTLCTIIRLFR